MRNGLILTLMMFAIVMVCMPKQSYGIAPTVNDIPNVVVGDAEDKATLDNLFVFPDALNLDSYVVDQDTPYSGITWSYTTPDPANPRYRINGVYPLDLTTDDPTSPPVSKWINNQVLFGDLNPDGIARTITIRDWELSPLGSLTFTDPGAAGLVNPGGELVTLFASDGFNNASDDLLVFTDNEGTDRFAGDFIPDSPITTIYFGNGLSGFSSITAAGSTTYSSTGGICIEVAATGTNVGAWVSAGGFIPLVADSIWRVRLTVSSNQTTVGDVPLWDVVIDNFTAAVGGPNGYGGDYLFLDNVGGADAAGTIGRTDFQVWFAPPAFQTAQWAGALAPGADAVNDMRVIYRVLDVDASGINSAADFGTICVTRLNVDRFDLDGMTVGDMVYPSNIALNHITPSTWTAADLLASTAVQFNVDNTVTIRPINPVIGWLDSVIDINPGDNFANPFTGEGVADNWPIPWESDTLYMVTSNWSAPDATSEAHPPDVIRIGMDSPQTEVTGLALTTPGLWDFATNAHFGMPTTTPQPFIAFFYSHTLSRTTTPNCIALRPRMDILNASQLVLGGVFQNTGAVKVHDCKVEKVTFPTTP